MGKLIVLQRTSSLFQIRSFRRYFLNQVRSARCPLYSHRAEVKFDEFIMDAPLFSGSQIIETETAKVEPDRPKPVPSLHPSEGGTLRSTPYYAPSELRKGILFAFIVRRHRLWPTASTGWGTVACTPKCLPAGRQALRLAGVALCVGG